MVSSTLPGPHQALVVMVAPQPSPALPAQCPCQFLFLHPAWCYQGPSEPQFLKARGGFPPPPCYLWGPQSGSFLLPLLLLLWLRTMPVNAVFPTRLTPREEEDSQMLTWDNTQKAPFHQNFPMKSRFQYSAGKRTFPPGCIMETSNQVHPRTE